MSMSSEGFGLISLSLMTAATEFSLLCANDPKSHLV